ncbi:MAG: hypothetical protein ACT4TC_11415 [Myxococcaceae bacterium]
MPSLLIIALLAQASAAPSPPPDAPLADTSLVPTPLADRPTYALGAAERSRRLTVIGGVVAGAGAVLFTIGTLQYESARRAAPENVERIRGSGLSNSIGGAALLLVGACFLWMSAVVGEWAFATEASPGK